MHCDNYPPSFPFPKKADVKPPNYVSNAGKESFDSSEEKSGRSIKVSSDGRPKGKKLPPSWHHRARDEIRVEASRAVHRGTEPLTFTFGAIRTAAGVNRVKREAREVARAKKEADARAAAGGRSRSRPAGATRASPPQSESRCTRSERFTDRSARLDK